MYEYFVKKKAVCGDSVEKLNYAYKKAKMDYENTDAFEEDRIKILCLLKEEKKIKQLFCILDMCEADNTDTLLEKIYEDEFNKPYMDWKQLLRIIGRVNEEKRNSLSQQYFGETQKGRSPGNLAKKIALILHEEFGDFEKYYFNIVKSLYSVIQKNEFLNVLEHKLKVLENKSKMQPFNNKVRKSDEIINYYLFLCEKGAYEAANSFLDRIWKEDHGDKLFGKDADEIKKMVYCWPSPSLLGFGKGYIKKCHQLEENGREYLGEQWIADVKATEKKAGSNEQWESIYKWLEVCSKVERLYVERNETNLQALSQIEMYDVQQHGYMTQICCQLAEIMQDWLLELNDAEFTEKIKCLGDKNIFSYKLYAWYTSPYRGYGKLEKTMQWEKLLDKIQKIKDVEKLIYVFFNSPIWLNMDFFDFVKLVNDTKDGNQKIEDLFKDYIIQCMIVDEDKKTSTGSQRFCIIPKYLFWTADIKSALRISPEWLKKNPTKISLQKQEGKDNYIQKSYDFKLCEMEGEVLYVVDSMYEKTAENDSVSEDEKENFLENLKNWFSYIRNQKCFVKWEMIADSETLKVKEEPFTQEERFHVAEEFLDVIGVLAEENQEEIWELLRCCSFRPLENINEFRYIAEQHWTDFELTETKEKVLYEKAKSILEQSNLSADLKLEIYMNTCAKKVYSLEELLQMEGIGELLFKENTEWVVPVKFEGHDKAKNITLFSMKPVTRKVRMGLKSLFVDDKEKQNIIKTNCTFYLNSKLPIPEEKLPKWIVNEGQPDEREETLKPKGRFVMYATLDEIDEKKRIALRKYFFDSEEVKQYFPWREYKKCLYDLKELKLIQKFPKENWEKIQDHNNALYLKVFKQLSKLDAETLLKEKGRVTPLVIYQQLVGEMDEVFQNIDMDLDICFHILSLLGEKNPFWSLKYEKYLSDEEMEEVRKVAKERFQKSFETFMDKLDGNSFFYVVTIFYLSHLRFFYLGEEEEFLEYIAERLGINELDFENEKENWEKKFLEETKAIQEFYTRLSEKNNT